MTHRHDESDLLAWIEGVDLPQGRVDRLERAFADDPSLKKWALDVRRDRDRLAALLGLDESSAPGGLVAGAMEIAEREALVGLEQARAPMPRAPRRIRVTPMRLVAAASIVIISGAATLVGVVFNSPAINSNRRSQNQQFPEAPADDGLASALAFNDGSAGQDAIESLDHAQSREGVVAQPELAIGALAMKSNVPASASASKRVASGGGQAERAESNLPPTESADTSPVQKSPLSFRLIHPIEHAPDHALSPKEAAALALEGKLLLLIRATDPAAVESTLLSQKRSDDFSAPRWRSIAQASDGAGQGASAGPEAARVVLVDVLTTPGAMEKLIAASTASGVGASGAWFQEMADAVPFKARLEMGDLMWWTQPAGLWAGRAAVPVLIERIAPVEPDASGPVPAPDPKPGSPSDHD